MELLLITAVTESAHTFANHLKKFADDCSWHALRFSLLRSICPISLEDLMRNKTAFALILVALAWTTKIWTQTPSKSSDASASLRPANRIVLPLANDRRVVLSGQRHPLARPEFAAGRVARDMEMGRMILVLQTDAAQDAALEELIRSQHDPESANYHQWLTPQEFGKRFGVSDRDMEQVAGWLQLQGLAIDEIPVSRRSVVFSGTAAQVETAFHTRMQHYRVAGAMHYANAKDPEIPEALSPVVRGVVSMHDFHSAPQHVAAPNNTASNGAHFLMPQDWVTIYDVAPLYRQGLDGTGQSIAVLGRVDVAMSDVRAFRTNAGLPPNDPQMIVNGPDPGFPQCDDEAESALDVEWAGAIAKNASVKFVTSKSGSSDGIALSAQYAVLHNVAPIISLSYGLCEAALGLSGNAFYNGIWSQAAAEGISVFVSSGDNGAAGCDSPSLKTATLGRGINGLCSSPYSTCVGGTQFDDAYTPAQYWSRTNGDGGSSALSYIPESTWNESSWSGGLWASSGGASALYSKPSWQIAPGVPADGKRDVPDISAHGSIMDAYVIQIQGKVFYVSGTSAAAPSLASVMALVNENKGAAQGNINPVLYRLAKQQLSSGGAAVFHDTINGNNSVPGVTGFNAGTGYDRATGLGSVDAAMLVNHWSDNGNSNFALTPNVSSVSMSPGGTATLSVTLTPQGGFTTPVTLNASGVPSGVSVRFSSATVSSAAPVTVTLTAAASATAGNFTLTITGSGAGLTRTAAIAVSIVVPSFTLSSTVSAATVTPGSSIVVPVTSSVIGSFRSAVVLTVTGLPRGLAATFSPASIASPGSGISNLMLTAASTAVAGVSTLTITGSGGGLTRGQTLALTIVVPSFTLTANPSNTAVTAGGFVRVTVSAVALNGFKSAVSLSITGLPKGITAAFAPTSISPGGNSALTLTAASGVTGGTFTLTIHGTSGGITRAQLLTLNVGRPSIKLSLGGTKATVRRNRAVPVTVSTTALNGFRSALILAVSGLPKGVTVSFVPANIASPGSGRSRLVLKPAAGAAVGTSILTVTASGGGITRTKSLSLTVQ
jgi:subtilase family serine protease